MSTDDGFSSAIGAPEDRRTLAISVADRLRRLIVEGQIPPGTRLRLHPLAARLGVSVMPVREAIRHLESESLVTVKPRRGAFVATLTSEDVEEIYLVRSALEGLASRLAVQRMGPATLTALHRLFDRMNADRDSGDLDRFIGDDREFHRVMFQATGRPQLVKKILDLWDASRRILTVTYKTRSPMDAAIESHAAILAACDAGDPRAAEVATRVHTEQAAARILAVLEDARETEARPQAPARSTAGGRRPSQRDGGTAPDRAS